MPGLNLTWRPCSIWMVPKLQVFKSSDTPYDFGLCLCIHFFLVQKIDRTVRIITMANHKMQNNFNLQSKWYTGIAIWKYLLSLVCSLVCFTYNWGLWAQPNLNISSNIKLCIVCSCTQNEPFLTQKLKVFYYIKKLFDADTSIIINMYSNSILYLFCPWKDEQITLKSRKP